jgi:MarR family transcriptional regulator, organic hydroperoxide resistance regulator
VNADVIRDSEDLIVQLRRIRLDLEGCATKSLVREKSNLSQYAVLSSLEEQGELTMGALAGHLGTTMGAVTNLVDKLVDSGRVSRARSDEDRRVVRVKILPAGKEMVTRVTHDTAEFLGGHFSGVPADERRTLVGVFSRLVQSMRPAARSKPS